MEGVRPSHCHPPSPHPLINEEKCEGKKKKKKKRRSSGSEGLSIPLTFFLASAWYWCHGDQPPRQLSSAAAVRHLMYVCSLLCCVACQYEVGGEGNLSQAPSATPATTGTLKVQQMAGAADVLTLDSLPEAMVWPSGMC